MMAVECVLITIMKHAIPVGSTLPRELVFTSMEKAVGR